MQQILIGSDNDKITRMSVSDQYFFTLHLTHTATLSLTFVFKPGHNERYLKSNVLWPHP